MTTAQVNAALRKLLLLGPLTLVFCGTGLSSFGADATLDTPSLSLRLQSGASIMDASAYTDQNQALLRQAPAITGRFQFQDRTYMPFIGAGFGGGYTSDRDRALGTNGPLPTQSGGLGKNVVPNEFNVGLRIPF